MPKIKKDGKTYHFPYSNKGIGDAKEMRMDKGKKKDKKKKTMFSGS